MNVYIHLPVNLKILNSQRGNFDLINLYTII